MNQPTATLIYPGDLNTLTGGYRYDKRMVEELRKGVASASASPWDISLISLAGDYPFPSDGQLKQAATQLDAIADHSTVVFDGLAYSVMPELIALHGQRLNIVALIHHPLALETGLSEKQARQFHALEKQALHYARHVITTSELTATSLKNYNVPGYRITAVPPGTDRAQQAKGSGTQLINLLCVATLTQRKGHHILLDALSELLHLPWKLNCVGSTERDRDTYHSLLKQCKQLNMQDRVSFLGEVSEAELERHYIEADAFVLASYHEGYGMVLTEAIARGLPIICSDAGAMRDTVPDKAGLLVPPGDSTALASALTSFMENAPLRTELATEAMAAREQLRSWQTAAQEFSAVLTQFQTDDT